MFIEKRMWFCVHCTSKKKRVVIKKKKNRTTENTSYFRFLFFYDSNLKRHSGYCTIWIFTGLNHPIITFVSRCRQTVLLNILSNQLTWYSCLHPRWDVCPFSMWLQFGCINGSQQFDHFFHHLLIQTQWRAFQLVTPTICRHGSALFKTL